MVGWLQLAAQMQLAKKMPVDIPNLVQMNSGSEWSLKTHSAARCKLCRMTNESEALPFQKYVAFRDERNLPDLASLWTCAGRWVAYPTTKSKQRKLMHNGLWKAWAVSRKFIQSSRQQEAANSICASKYETVWNTKTIQSVWHGQKCSLHLENLGKRRCCRLP